MLSIAFETGAGFEHLEELSTLFRRVADSRRAVAQSMVPFMLVDTPDDRYRGQPGPSWRRVLRLLAAAVACFLVGAVVLPWIGFLFDIGAVVLILLALCALDD